MPWSFFVLQRPDLLFSEACEFNNLFDGHFAIQHPPCDLFGSFLHSFLLGIADLVAYVTFGGHGVFVFDFVLGSKCSNICRIKQQFKDFLPQLGQPFLDVVRGL